MNIWNPAAFFISLMMSFIMAAIFGLPMGMPIDALFYLWPVRWVTAYLLINIIIYPIGFGLAEKVFHFNPDRDGMGFWNPAAFFISLMMSFIMAAIFGLPMGMPIEYLFLLWPVRWAAAYLLINTVIYPIGFGLAKKVFGFDPMAH